MPGRAKAGRRPKCMKKPGQLPAPNAAQVFATAYSTVNVVVKPFTRLPAANHRLCDIVKFSRKTTELLGTFATEINVSF